jgi:hypothetical protein
MWWKPSTARRHPNLLLQVLEGKSKGEVGAHGIKVLRAFFVR